MLFVFGGLDALMLLGHVTFECFIGNWKILFYIGSCDCWPGSVVAIFNCFKMYMLQETHLLQINILHWFQFLVGHKHCCMCILGLMSVGCQ